MWLVQSTMTLISDTLNGNILPTVFFVLSCSTYKSLSVIKLHLSFHTVENFICSL